MPRRIPRLWRRIAGGPAGLARGPIQPSPDSAEQRQALRALTTCLANARPRWARRTLSRPYLSDAQASDASQAFVQRKRHLHSDGRRRDHVSNVQPRRQPGRALSARRAGRRRSRALSAALFTLTPLNVSEDFALCVAARNHAAAHDLALSEFGSAAEMRQRGRRGRRRPCTYDGEQLTVDLQALRAGLGRALSRDRPFWPRTDEEKPGRAASAAPFHHRRVTEAGASARSRFPGPAEAREAILRFIPTLIPLRLSAADAPGHPRPGGHQVPADPSAAIVLGRLGCAFSEPLSAEPPVA